MQLTETQGQIRGLGVLLAQFSIQERTTNFPDIKHEQNIRKAFAAFVVFILAVILVLAIASYFSKKSKKR